MLLNTTGLCTVPNVKGKTLPRAKRMIVRAHCRVGKVRWAYSKIVRPPRVISEAPKPGTLLPKRGKVKLIVSRGGSGRCAGRAKSLGHFPRPGPLEPLANFIDARVEGASDKIAVKIGAKQASGRAEIGSSNCSSNC